MTPRIHILHTERYLHKPTLIESGAVRDRFKVTKDSRLRGDSNLVYTQSYASSDIIHILRICTVPYVVHMGGDIWYELMEDPNRLMAVNEILRKATLIVANSVFLYRIVVANGFKNVIFLPGGLWGFDESVHGVMPQRFHPKKRHPEKAKKFLMSISLKVKKKYRGIELLMRAAGEYFREEKMQVVCAGKIVDHGEANRLESKYGVQFLGNRTDWNTFLPSTDVFLHPSMFDCFPRALAEAKCAGLPAVSFQVAGNVEVGDAPVYVDPGDKDGVVSAIKTVAENQELREYLGQLGVERAMWKTERHRGDYPDIFKTILGEGPSRLIQEAREAIT